MNYNYVNKELRIAKCNRCDVPEKFAGKIEDATFFYYDREADSIVFITGRNDCDFFIQIAEMYLQLSEDLRKRIREQDPAFYDRIGVTEMFVIWEAVAKHREKLKVETDYNELRGTLGKARLQPVLDHMDMLNAIRDNETPDGRQSYFLFLYGYMMGKRDERARRKKVQANE